VDAAAVDAHNVMSLASYGEDNAATRDEPAKEIGYDREWQLLGR